MDSINRFSPYIALIGALICLTQLIILLVQGEPLCLNQGCEIVEQLTAVPPLYFHAAGCAYFSILFLCMKNAKSQESPASLLTTLLLTAGIAAEGVLINFQHFIAQAFCSYCLIIFLFILLLNILAGWKRCLTAFSIFCAITLAFFSLDFSSSSTADQQLENGTIATRPGAPSSPNALLFFSSTCAHCENVIEFLKENDKFNLSFNPIDEIKNFDFPGSLLREGYRTDINRRFLQSLGITEIPVLILKQDDGMEILRGENRIIERLAKPDDTTEDQFTGMSSSNETIPGLGGEGEDGCTIDTDCVDGTDPALPVRVSP